MWEKSPVWVLLVRRERDTKIIVLAWWNVPSYPWVNAILDQSVNSRQRRREKMSQGCIAYQRTVQSPKYGQ